MRNVICISDFPPDLHEWVKAEAKRRGKEIGKRYSVALVFLEAVAALKTKIENNHHDKSEEQVARQVTELAVETIP